MNEKLYHMVPLKMQGNELMPLNGLKEVHPDLHDEEEKKYKGREHLINEVIKPLNCTRRDLINLSAIHPERLNEMLRECGRAVPIGHEFFEIDPHSLNMENAIVENTAINKLEKYDPDNISKHAEITEEMREYYKKEYEKGEHPLPYQRVPHILYKGTIDVSNAKRIPIQNINSKE